MASVTAIDAARLGDQSLSLERLPQLGLALSRTATFLAEGLRPYFAVEPVVALTHVDKMFLTEALATFSQMTSARLYADSGDGRLLVGVERASLNLLIEAMLGRAPQEAGAERPPTEFDLRAARSVFETLSGALRDAFASVAASEFSIQRIETRVNDSLLPSSTGAAFVVFYDIRVFEARARLILVVPHDALTNIRQKLAQTPAMRSDDPQWLVDLGQRVGEANVVVKAIAVERTLTLRDISVWRVGTLIDLPGDALNSIALAAEGTRLCIAQLGQADGRYTLRIGVAESETINQERQGAYVDEREF